MPLLLFLFLFFDFLIFSVIFLIIHQICYLFVLLLIYGILLLYKNRLCKLLRHFFFSAWFVTIFSRNLEKMLNYISEVYFKIILINFNDQIKDFNKLSPKLFSWYHELFINSFIFDGCKVPFSVLVFFGAVHGKNCFFVAFYICFICQFIICCIIIIWLWYF